MVVLLPLKRYVRTMTDFAKLMDMLLDRARSAGADAADGIVVGGHGHSVSVRLGEVEAIERSEDHDIGLRVFVDVTMICSKSRAHERNNSDRSPP